MTTEYLDSKSAMKYLGVSSYQALKNLINAGLPVIMVGKTKRFSKSAIDKFMQEHQTVKG